LANKFSAFQLFRWQRPPEKKNGRVSTPTRKRVVHTHEYLAEQDDKPQISGKQRVSQGSLVYFSR